MADKKSCCNCFHREVCRWRKIYESLSVDAWRLLEEKWSPAEGFEPGHPFQADILCLSFNRLT